MWISQSLDVLMFVAVIGLLMSGYPIALVLAGTGLLFAAIGTLFGVFDFALMAAIPSRLFGIMSNQVLIAVPLFVFMGAMLQRTNVADELLATLAGLFGRTPGGLGLSVIVVGALMAASTGIVGATVVTMGIISLPVLLKNGTPARLAAGIITASGSLGQIIPPSILLVVLADQISNAWQLAQQQAGVFSPNSLSVGDLFAGALLPGLLLVVFYLIYVAMVSRNNPAQKPPGETQRLSPGAVLRTLVAPLSLILAVLGSILAGIATSTEAASIGAIGAILLGAGRPGMPRRRLVFLCGGSMIALLMLTQFVDLRPLRQQISNVEMLAIGLAAILVPMIVVGLGSAIMGLLRNKLLRPVITTTTQVTAMIFLILIGASIFSLVFRGLGGDETIQNALDGLPGGTFGALLAVMAMMFFLGFFLEFLEITFVVVPLVAPILLQLPMADGAMMNPVWLGIMIAIILQTSFLTPPFGIALFYLRGVAPASVRTIDIYYGVIPFVAIQLLVLAILWTFPPLANWLPGIIFGVD